MPYGYGGGSGPGPGGQSSDRGGSLSGRGRDDRPGPSRRDHHPPAQPVAHTVDPTAQYDDRIQRIAAQNQRTAALRNRASNQGFHQFLTPRDQIAKKTLGMRLSGLGGLFGALGRGALSFFGGIPGKALSGILTASDYAKRKGTGVWEGLQDFGEGVQEFGEHDNLMSYLNRNKVQAIKPIESMPTNQEIIGERIGEYWRQPQNNNLGVDNQFIEEEQNLYPNVGLGAAEGGRIGYNRGRVVNPGGYQGDIEIPEGFLEGLPNEDYQKMIEELMKQKKQEELMRELGPFQWAADGGIARLL